MAEVTNTGAKSPAQIPGMEWLQNLKMPTYEPGSLQDAILKGVTNDPGFLAGGWQTNDDYARAMQRAQQSSQLSDKAYQLALSRIDGGSSIGLDEPFNQQLDALRKEQAARKYANDQVAQRETAASGGFLRSGTYGFNLGEMAYGYQNLLKEIDLAAQARAARIEAAKADAARSAANQRASLELQRTGDKIEEGWRLEDLTRGRNQDMGKLITATGERLMEAWFVTDPSLPGGGYYRGPDGSTWDASGKRLASVAPSTPPATVLPQQTQAAAPPPPPPPPAPEPAPAPAPTTGYFLPGRYQVE